ncbi:hypothetical protein QJS10_CPB11g02176 [Acorus calamus]|uniref:Uncharacterized protein n=1 Tax=Acorus calamus TaxID=4465 RepID=A0AAV9DVM2_ACOCL|nr:hypothetical protein QJS10_CPB11g02176 [Acorus calamus]
MYRSSTAEDRSPCSARTSDSDVGLGEDSRLNSRSAVYWDQEAGRFVWGMARSSASSSRVGGRSELVFTGQSIFFGGPLLGERGSSSSSGRGRGGSHPVFVLREQQRMP